MGFVPLYTPGVLLGSSAVFSDQCMFALSIKKKIILTSMNKQFMTLSIYYRYYFFFIFFWWKMKRKITVTDTFHLVAFKMPLRVKIYIHHLIYLM